MPETSALGNLIPSRGLFVYFLHTYCIHTQKKTNKHTNIKLVTVQIRMGLCILGVKPKAIYTLYTSVVLAWSGNLI